VAPGGEHAGADAVFEADDAFVLRDVDDDQVFVQQRQRRRREFFQGRLVKVDAIALGGGRVVAPHEMTTRAQAALGHAALTQDGALVVGDVDDDDVCAEELQHRRRHVGIDGGVDREGIRPVNTVETGLGLGRSAIL
jgi:hypothetical protein